jgi:hypothetical protein
VVRRPELRPRLVEAVRGADRLVLLGDIFELRERSLVGALALALPLLEELAGALAGEREIVLVPGNHDHALVGPLCASIGSKGGLRSLEHRLRPAPGHPLARLASDLAPARLEFAYPGLWLTDGVYATHGHYIDVHSPVPMVECLAIALSARLRGGPPGLGSTPVDYERVVSPVYMASTTIGRGQSLGRGRAGGISMGLYERLTRRMPDVERGGGIGLSHGAGADKGDSAPAVPRSTPPPADLGDHVLRRAIPSAVAVLNRLGLGPFAPDISGHALRRAGLQAMADVVHRLDIEAEYVVFGHTHRPGPLPTDGDDDWTVPARRGRPPTRLINTGSWVYQPFFLATRPSDSPYWPGRCVVVEDGSAPSVLHPLADAGHDELEREVTWRSGSGSSRRKPSAREG